MEILNLPQYLSYWMSHLPGYIKLRDLVIPGSHDANSFDLYKPKVAVPFSQCQKLSILNQLKSGIRFMDLRYSLSKAKKLKKLGINR